MLEKNIFYMNPWTGSVAKGAEWMQEFADREDQEMSWEEWGGLALEAVVEKRFFDKVGWEEVHPILAERIFERVRQKQEEYDEDEYWKKFGPEKLRCIGINCDFDGEGTYLWEYENGALAISTNGDPVFEDDYYDNCFYEEMKEIYVTKSTQVGIQAWQNLVK